MLEAVKLALGVTVDAYDTEIQDLIDAAVLDLKIAGVVGYADDDKLVLQAIKTYCRAHFRSPADYDNLISAYYMQKGNLMHATGYTNFGDGGDGGCFDLTC